MISMSSDELPQSASRMLKSNRPLVTGSSNLVSIASRGCPSLIRVVDGDETIAARIISRSRDTISFWCCGTAQSKGGDRASCS